MKKILQYLFFTVFLSGSFSVQSQQIFKAILSGVNETPPALSSGSGIITGELNGNTLTISGNFEGLTTVYTVSHIHQAIAGTAGPVVIALTPNLNTGNKGGTYQTASNTFALTSNQIALLGSRQLYVNVHSQKYPAGELRGQLVPESDAYYSVNLFGTNEVPIVLTRGWGNIIAELKGNSLSVSGSFSRLESNFNGGAHIHTGTAGHIGGIIKNLTVVSGSDNKSGTILAANNTFTLTPSELDTLNKRGLYINIHTVDHPSGDIRGQILPVSDAVLNAVLEGEEENPPVETIGQGRLVIELKNDKIMVSGSFVLESNFNGGAHIHLGMAGSNGAIVFPLVVNVIPDNISGNLAVANNTFTVTSQQITTFLERGYYANIHSVQHPTGEIRAQILPLANAYFFSRFSGYNEPTPIVLDSNGAVVTEWLQDSIHLSGTFSKLKSKYNATIGSHIHEAAAGVNGPIRFHLDPVIVNADSLSGTYLADSNRFPLTEAQKTTLLNQGFYTNIHTADHPSGETRGQIMSKLNFFPEASSITSPANGASITLQGLPSDPFIINFTTATDPEGDKVFYVWQLALDQNLSTVILTTNTGTTSQFTTTKGVFDNLLATAGVQPGTPVTFHQRVITSDGSLLNFSDTASVTITRGVVSSTINQLISSVEIYPNPVNQKLCINFSRDLNASMEIQLVDINGKVAYKTSGRSGDKMEIQLNDIIPGVYFINIISEGKLIATEKIIKE